MSENVQTLKEWLEFHWAHDGYKTGWMTTAVQKLGRIADPDPALVEAVAQAIVEYDGMAPEQIADGILEALADELAR